MAHYVKKLLDVISTAKNRVPKCVQKALLILCLWCLTFTTENSVITAGKIVEGIGFRPTQFSTFCMLY